MKLKKMHVCNFRSLRDVTVPFRTDLTVLIGENDAGKSSVLDILGMVLDAPSVTPAKIPRPQEADFYQDPNGKQTSSITVELTFQVLKEELEKVGQQFVDSQGQLHLRASYSPNEAPLFEVKRQTYAVDALNRSDKELERMKKPEQEKVLEELGLDPGNYPNAAKRVEAIQEAREKHEPTFKWTEITHSQLKQLGLPAWNRYRALDYEEPERIVNKTIKEIFTQVLKQPELEGALRQVKEMATQAIEEKVKELEEFVQRFLPKGKRIDYVPDLSFPDAFKGGEFRVDKGQGLHHISRVGDGTKRRMLMGIMEWDRTVQRSLGTSAPTIRGYDEPDTNLHPRAQRQFFQTLTGILQDSPHIQIILCTHSVFMVNAAPVSSIVHLRVDAQGCAFVEQLTQDKNDEQIAEFLQNVAAQMGVTNSVLFFDRCYLLVEGETEHIALPILYRRMYRHSLSEDGIAIINLAGHNKRAEFLRLLGKRRSSIVVCLLDNDALDEHRKDMIENDWPPKHINQALFGIGNQEFEDAFPDQVWAQAFESVPEWKRQDGLPWDAGHIAPLRDSGKKFSEELVKLLWCHSVARNHTSRVSKPRMGEVLAKTVPRDQIPQAIKDVFERARQIAGVSP